MMTKERFRKGADINVDAKITKNASGIKILSTWRLLPWCSQEFIINSLSKHILSMYDVSGTGLVKVMVI